MIQLTLTESMGICQSFIITIVKETSKKGKLS